MKLSKTPTAEELQVISRFESLRSTLLSGQYGSHLSKPLAYWALPSDRRLPLAFLGRTLSDLLGTPFPELIATPGIGQKKIRSFLKLLSRVVDTDPSELPSDGSDPQGNGKPAESVEPGSDAFDPAGVSEVVWSQWRASVLQHGLGKEPLGRFAPSLKNLTRVIWNKPLETYADCTLEQIRGLKTHGEKRVHAILEAFCSVHAIVAHMGTQPHLVARIVPRCIDAAESWAGRTLQTPGIPSRAEIFQGLLSPLLEQIRTDAAPQIVGLAHSRLGLEGPITSVRQAARLMGLTRARVYQLLNEINDIMQVRWPMGRHQVYELRDKFQREAACAEPPPDLEQFHAAIELFYPGSRRGAAGPLERAFDAELRDEEPASGNGQAEHPAGHAMSDA